MNFMTILDIVRDVIDIIIVWALFYALFKNIRNNVKLSLLFKGIIFLIILSIIGVICKS